MFLDDQGINQIENQDIEQGLTQEQVPMLPVNNQSDSIAKDINLIREEYSGTEYCVGFVAIFSVLGVIGVLVLTLVKLLST